MGSLEACRMCLAVNTRLCKVIGTPLQEVYERITKLPLKSNDGRPVLACYVCHHLLRRCQILIERSLIADKLLKGILDSGTKLTENSLRKLRSKHLRPLLSVFSNHKTVESPEREIEDMPVKVECTVDRFDMNNDETKLDFGTEEVIIKKESPDIEDYHAETADHLLQPEASEVPGTPRDGIYAPKSTLSMEKDELAKHVNENEALVIGGINKKLFCCNLCDRTFKWSGHLKSHIRIHNGEKPFRCNQCDKAFTNSSNLKTHTRTHTGERPFQCKECNRTFSENGTLKLHMRIHTGERPYQCSQCDKAFIKNSKLKVHMRLHTGERPYQCGFCERSFTGSSSLKFHIRTHTGERPYQCSGCEQKFSQKSALNVHMRLHTGEKPFICNLCDRAFIRKDHLKSHLQTHRGEKPYKCSHCPEAFRWKSTLVTHVNMHAREKI